MLLYQGALAFEIWFEREAPIEARAGSCDCSCSLAKRYGAPSATAQIRFALQVLPAFVAASPPRQAAGREGSSITRRPAAGLRVPPGQV